MGLIALIVALGGSGSSKELETKLAEAVKPIGELDGEMDAVALRLSDIERSQNAGADQISRANRDLSELTQQTKQALTQVSTEINKNRELINQLSDRLKPKTTTSTTSASTGTSTRTTSGSDTSTTSTASADKPADGQYKIQKGDTLSAIADRYGITLADLLNANPGVEPRYLKVGQTINLP